MQRQGLLHHFQIRLSECCLEPITVSNWYFTSHIVWDYELRSIPSFLVFSLEVEGQIRSQDSICAQRKWTNWTILISTVPQSIGMKMCTLKAAHRPSRLVKYLLCQTWIGNNLWSSLMIWACGSQKTQEGNICQGAPLLVLTAAATGSCLGARM